MRCLNKVMEYFLNTGKKDVRPFSNKETLN